jgi:hypothetical protein
MKPKTWNFLSEVKTGAGLDGTGRDWTGLDGTGRDWTGLDGTGRDVLSGIGGLNLETAGQTWRPGIRTEKCCQNPTIREKLSSQVH